MSYMQNPAKSAAAVVADTAFPMPCVGIYVGVGGDVQVTLVGGATVVFTAVPAGSILPIRATVVVSTSTTATNMVALFN